MPLPKILFVDIETSPLLARPFGTFKQNIGLNMIVEDWHMLSFCAKWYGEEEIIYMDNSKKKDVSDDLHLLKRLHKLLDEADIVVAHNGIRFDVPKINYRFIIHGMAPPSPFKIADTLSMAKRHLGATSKKLEFLTDKLCVRYKKLTHAKFAGFELWKQVLAGNKEAWVEMKEYNIMDVLSLEELYTKLRPWWSSHPNIGVYKAHEGMCCSKCGSHSLQKRGFDFTVIGKFQRYQCKDCGGWSRGRKSAILKEDRETILTTSARN